MKLAFIYKFIAFAAVLVFTGMVAAAQNRLAGGDEFQRQVLTNSNCVLQRGNQTLQVSSSAAMVKRYKVTANGKQVTVSVTIDKLTDTINAMNQQLVYTSAKPADPKSDIQNGLQKLANTTWKLNANMQGQITGGQLPAADDNVLSFAGIQPDNLSPGNLLPFLAGLPAASALKKGYTWTAAVQGGQTVYTVYAATPRTTTLTYKTSVLGGNLNSRINGTVLIDNATGVILKRYAQTVSTGYEMVNGVVYTATRRTATTEVTVKK